MTLETNQNVEAEIRVERKMGFLIHAFLFVAVTAGLIQLNLTNNSDHLWFLLPLGGWGIGLAFHGVRMFGNGKLKRNRIERETSSQKQEMAKH